MLFNFAVLLATLSTLQTGVNSECSNASGDSCGNAEAAYCCQDNMFCMPWNLGYYQCLPLPGACSRQFTNYDFYGNDIEIVYGILPGECCDRCVETSGCLAYTFVNDNVGQPACYLKAGMGNWRITPGVISAVIDSYTTEQDKTDPDGRIRRLAAIDDLMRSVAKGEALNNTLV